MFRSILMEEVKEMKSRMSITTRFLGKSISLVAVTAGLLGCASSDKPKPSMNLLNDFQGKQVAAPVGLLFAGMDENRDVKISSDEIRLGGKELFTISDLDGDAALTPTEFGTFSETHLGGTYSSPSRMQFDRNQDQKISLDEFQQTLETVRQKLDKNNDGALARSELVMNLNLPGNGVDVAAMRRQMEAQMRRKMEEAMRKRRKFKENN